ncbi:MAG: YIP1 family protein [Bacillota bacterium]|nr:YIP1 family protein [Bacillota bacterium]
MSEVHTNNKTRADSALMNLLGRFKNDFWSFPLYILGRPFKGFDEMKYEGRGSLGFAIVIFFLSALMNIVEFVYCGFLVNYNNPYQINSLFLALVTIFPVLLFMVANWSVTTLLEGKGRMKDIFMVMMYAMFPFLLLRLISLVLTNVLTLDEMMISSTLTGIGSVLFFVYTFIGLVVVHEYGLGAGVGSILLTLIAMMIIVFILMLFFTLVADLVDFVTVFGRELMLKYF